MIVDYWCVEVEVAVVDCDAEYHITLQLETIFELELAVYLKAAGSYGDVCDVAIWAAAWHVAVEVTVAVEIELEVLVWCWITHQTSTCIVKNWDDNVNGTVS